MTSELTKEQKARFDKVSKFTVIGYDYETIADNVNGEYVLTEDAEQFLASELELQKSEIIRAIDKEIYKLNNKYGHYNHSGDRVLGYIEGLEYCKKIISEEK